MQIAIVLSLLVLAVALFTTERLPVDVITLLLLVVLVGSGVLTPAEAFEGFSSDIIIILGSIFVISGALQETGLLRGWRAIGETRRVWPKDPATYPHG
jgi:di/tricarboxylate transporter